jgi:hypothetical protein
MTGTRRVVLIVPDAGPLISLGKADRLPILLKLNLPIYVVDQVHYEVTHDKRFADAVRIERFVRDNPGLVHVFATAVGAAAAERRAAGETGRQKGQGEAAIAEFLNRLDEVTDADAPVMLLYEDSDIMKSNFVLPGNVHPVGTWPLLLRMEALGLIESAEEIWDEIESAGRKPAKDDDPDDIAGGPPV